MPAASRFSLVIADVAGHHGPRRRRAGAEPLLPSAADCWWSCAMAADAVWLVYPAGRGPFTGSGPLAKTATTPNASHSASPSGMIAPSRSRGSLTHESQ